MTSLRDEAVRDVEALILGVDQLSEHLRSIRDTYTELRRILEEGGSVAGALRAVGADEARQAMTAVLDDFERRRHDSRLSLIAADLDEGSTINEISRTWGISRQLASRYVKAIRVRV